MQEGIKENHKLKMLKKFPWLKFEKSIIEIDYYEKLLEAKPDRQVNF